MSKYFTVKKYNMTKYVIDSWYRVPEKDESAFIADIKMIKVAMKVKMEEGQAKTQTQVPTKVQRIGNPGKVTALYIEDYVYTFLKQLLLLKDDEMILDIYGTQIKSQKKNHIIVTAAREHLLDEEELDDNEKNIREQSGVEKEEYERDNDFFSGLHRIGTIHMDTNRRNFQNGMLQLRLTNQSKQNMSGFYVFYDKNEPMQNYLIAWHQGNIKEKEHSDMKIKYAKRLQETQHHQVKDSYWKQCVTGVVATFFVVLCVLAITVINNYQKMMSLQDHVSYIVDCMADDHSQVETMIHQNADVLSRLFQDESEWQTNTDENASEEEKTEKQITTEETSSTDMDNSKNNSEETSNISGTGSKDQTLNTAASDNEEETSNTLANDSKEQTSVTTETDTKEETTLDLNETIKAESNTTDDSLTKTTDSSQENTNSKTDSTKGSTQENKEADNNVVEKTTESGSTYLVSQGDTLQSILYKQYGSINKMDQVCELNQINNPDEIRIGQKLYLP